MSAADDITCGRQAELLTQARELMADAGDLHAELAHRLHQRVDQLDTTARALGVDYTHHSPLLSILATLLAEVDTLVGSAARLHDIPHQNVVADWTPPQVMVTATSAIAPVLTVPMPDADDTRTRLRRVNRSSKREQHLHPALCTAYAGKHLTAAAVVALYARVARDHAAQHHPSAQFHQTLRGLGHDFPRYAHALLPHPLAYALVMREWQRSPLAADHTT